MNLYKKCTYTELLFQRVVIISSFREGKWFVPHDLYPYVYYPDYCFGPFYALSFANLYKIFQNIENVPYFDIEDVYLTGLVAEKVSGMLCVFPSLAWSWRCKRIAWNLDENLRFPLH